MGRQEKRSYSLSQLRSAWAAGRYSKGDQSTTEKAKPIRGWGLKYHPADFFDEPYPDDFEPRMDRELGLLLWGLAPEELYDLWFKAIEMIDTLILGGFRPSGYFIATQGLAILMDDCQKILETRFSDWEEKRVKEFQRRWPQGRL